MAALSTSDYRDLAELCTVSLKEHAALPASERPVAPQRLQETMREAFKKNVFRPHDFSLRQLWIHTVPDGREALHLLESQGTASLFEAGVQTANFANITQQVLSQMALEQLTPVEHPFQALIPKEPTKYKGEKIPGVSGLGDVGAIVPEGAEFPTAGPNEDWIETPMPYKRGVMVEVTKEAIFFDQTGLVLDQARSVGEALALSLEKRAIDCIIDENTTAHRYKWRGTTYATYQTSTPWDNVSASSTLEDWTDINNVMQTFNGLLDPNTGEPIVVTPTHLICAQETEWTARKILNATMLATAVGGYATSGNLNSHQFPNMVPKLNLLTTAYVASRQATDTSWYVGNPAKAFGYKECWPIQVLQAPPNSEMEFTRDIAFRFRASEMGAFYTREPRQMVKATVA